MYITIEFFAGLMTDVSCQKAKIYDLKSEKLVWEGYLDDVPYELLDEEIISIDCIENNIICFNVEIIDGED